MSNPLAQILMDRFAADTGIVGDKPPRRYLWTDSFAVCNFLGLARETGDNQYLNLARRLVDQVHHILGRHRDDDSRQGWISGLPEEEGEKHPTCGGLRIGKPLNERQRDEPPDSQLEWDQDGQYFHYLTKWTHALHCMGLETGESRYQVWAAELASSSHVAFTHRWSPSGPQRMAWKMSIDLSRPLVASMGQHDPLDGLITCLELQNTEGFGTEWRVDLIAAIADMTEMTANAHWTTDDPLGIGGLLDDAQRLARLVFEHSVPQYKLLRKLLVAAEFSLRRFGHPALFRRPAEQRLAFRELGLSIGLHGLRQIWSLVAQDPELKACSDSLLPFEPLAAQIEAFWSDPVRRRTQLWLEHCDINSVMLATSLAPDGYLSR